jgi:hypothetical protein
MLLSKVLKMQ